MEDFNFSHRAVEGVRVGAWKLRVRDGVELFDVESDPAERYNRAEEFPERGAELTARDETMTPATSGQRKRG